MEKRANIFDCTEKVLNTVGRTWDDVISTTFIYVPAKEDGQPSTRGINLQLFGHVLIIVPDETNYTDYHMYTTKNNIDRNHIINDMIARGYDPVQVAKMMKCSQGTVVHVLNMSKTEPTKIDE